MTVLASSYFEGFGNVFVFAALGAVFVFLNLFVLGLFWERVVGRFASARA